MSAPLVQSERAVSIVVPVYNGRGTLAELVTRIARAIDGPFEAILGDAGQIADTFIFVSITFQIR